MEPLFLELKGRRLPEDLEVALGYESILALPIDPAHPEHATWRRAQHQARS